MKNNKTTQKLKVWKTLEIDLGNYSELKSLESELYQNGILRQGSLSNHFKLHVGYSPKKEDFFIENFVKMPEENLKLSLVRLRLEDMGFKNAQNISYKTLCKRAKFLGLQLCPQEIISQLALDLQQNCSNEKEEWHAPLVIVTKPFSFRNALTVLDFEKDENQVKLKYHLYAGYSKFVFDSNSFLFVQC